MVYLDGEGIPAVILFLRESTWRFMGLNLVTTDICYRPMYK